MACSAFDNEVIHCDLKYFFFLNLSDTHQRYILLNKHVINLIIILFSIVSFRSMFPCFCFYDLHTLHLNWPEGKKNLVSKLQYWSCQKLTEFFFQLPDRKMPKSVNNIFPSQRNPQSFPRRFCAWKYSYCWTISRQILCAKALKYCIALLYYSG